MLAAAGASDTLVAAGYLHDVIEDTDMSADQLESEIGNCRVRELVEAVTELDKSQSWEDRNGTYLERMQATNDTEVLLLSCADKTTNLREMCFWLEHGYKTEDFTSRDHETQENKFIALDKVYRGCIGGPLYDRFDDALRRFMRYGSS